MSDFKSSSSSHTSTSRTTTNSTISATNKKRYCQRCIQSSEKDLSDKAVFLSSRELYLHLREYHCTKEGGSFICHYGPNDVCPSLPVDGVSELDYQDHVWKDHILLDKMDYKKKSSDKDKHCEDHQADEPSIVKDQYKWTVYMSQVNLPALLNDPRLTRRETDFFTKTWGEGFERSSFQPSPHIPTITYDHFKNFLIKTNARNKGKKKLKTSSSDEIAQKQIVESTFKTEEFDVIPKIFFNPSFSLLDADTFNFVLPWSAIESSSSSQQQQQQHCQQSLQLSSPQHKQPQKRQPQLQPLQSQQQKQQLQQQTHQPRSSKLLQEKLSHYLDLIEVQITKQISCKSDAFFDAMASQNNLQGHLQNTRKSVLFLREKMRHLDEVMVKQPLHVIHQYAVRCKYQQILEKLKLMLTVQQTQPTLQLLLTTNDFLGALDLISTTQEVLTQELAGLHCFRHLGSQLHEMEKLVVRMIQDEFASFITGFFNQPVLVDQIGDDVDAIYRKPHPLPLMDSCPVIDFEKLLLISLGIYRHHKINFMDDLHLESTTTIRTVIKQTVIEAVVMTEVYESDNNKLASQMRLLTYDQWLAMLRKLFISLVLVLQRVQAVVNVLRLIGRTVAEKISLNVDSSVEKHQTVDRNMLKNNSTFCLDADESSAITLPSHKDNYYDDYANGVASHIGNFYQQLATTSTETTSTSTTTSSSTTTSTSLVKEPATHDDKYTGLDATSSSNNNNDNNNNSNNVSNVEVNSCCDDKNDNKLLLQNGEDEDDDVDDATAAFKKEIQEMLKDCDPILSHVEWLKMSHSLNELICKVTEHAHDRCFKLFTARAKDGFLDRLSMSEFLELSRCVEWFSSQTYRICGRRSMTLRGHLQNQVMKFVSKFHEEKKNKLCLILDKERWKQVDVPMEFQELADHITNSGDLSLPAKKTDPDSRTQEYLLVKNEKFILVGTALILLKMMVEYCQFVDEMPCTAADMLSRLVDLLKTFNSRTCQLILGAGALHLVGLKTINAKNLALASRCLQLFVYYLPMVKEHFAAHLTDKQAPMIKRVDHLIKDYNNHIVELSMKLVSIMDAAILNALSKYELKSSSSSSSSASSTFENITKQLTRFHEAISTLLTTAQIQCIINQFHVNFVLSLKRNLASLHFNKDDRNMKSALDCDIKLYTRTIKGLPGFEDFPFTIDDVIGD